MDERLMSKLMDRYPKAVVHLRSQYQRKRFGLVFGSGVSGDFNIPGWKQLLERIANNPEVEAPWRSDQSAGTAPAEPLSKRRAELLPITLADLLRCHFDARTLPKLKGMDDDRAVQRELTGRWLRIIRDELYHNPLSQEEDLEKNHPYLGKFLDIIPNCRITINYNFDDCIERMMNRRRQRNKTPLCESAYGDFLGTGAERPLIYHPNGFLPRNALEGCSDDIVLSEREFNEQSGHSFAVRTDFLAQHFAANTCLLLGLSVQDELLRRILRRAARVSPGQFHYCVEFLESEQQLTEGEMNAALSRSRLDNYNLITLFLTNEQIAALGVLIREEENEFLERAERNKHRTTFTYYITGVRGVGKTSVLRHFNSLYTHGEWIDAPPSFFWTKPYKEWSDEEERKARRFYAKQYALRNKILWESPESREGIHLVESTPLDFVAGETDQEEIDLLRGAIGDESIRNGTIIRLVGDSKEIAARLLVYCRLTQSPVPGDEAIAPDGLDERAAALEKMYPKDSLGIFVRHTDGCSLNEVVRKVADIIFSKEYAEFDINRHFECFSNAGNPEPE